MLDEIKFLKKRGQRTKYLPEFCDQLVEHMSSGFSFDSFKAVTGSSLVAMYDWVDRYPDWAYAKEQGNGAGIASGQVDAASRHSAGGIERGLYRPRLARLFGAGIAAR